MANVARAPQPVTLKLQCCRQMLLVGTKFETCTWWGTHAKSMQILLCTALIRKKNHFRFAFQVLGRGGHGAMPHLAHDPVVRFTLLLFAKVSCLYDLRPNAPKSIHNSVGCSLLLQMHSAHCLLVNIEPCPTAHHCSLCMHLTYFFPSILDCAALLDAGLSPE